MGDQDDTPYMPICDIHDTKQIGSGVDSLFDDEVARTMAQLRTCVDDYFGMVEREPDFPAKVEVSRNVRDVEVAIQQDLRDLWQRCGHDALPPPDPELKDVLAGLSAAADQRIEVLKVSTKPTVVPFRHSACQRSKTPLL